MIKIFSIILIMFSIFITSFIVYALSQEEIKLLNRGRAHYVVELYPDGTGTTKYLLIGKENGAEITGGTIVTGAAAGDLQGFTLTAVASEVNPPFFATAPDESATTPITPA